LGIGGWRRASGGAGNIDVGGNKLGQDWFLMRSWGEYLLFGKLMVTIVIGVSCAMGAICPIVPAFRNQVGA
jgi:VIT1/CCC1 family predicted Fe2+/Mn2+ transporter